MATALSKKAEAYVFLQQPETQITEHSTSWEDNAAKVSLNTRFANSNTGTIEFTVSPEVLSQLELLKQMKVTADFIKLATFVQALQRTMPSNEGRLLCFINPAVLAGNVPFCDSPSDITEDMIKESTINLEFTDDMALVEGVPVWERLESERLDFYQLFKVYRDMRYTVTTDGDYFLLDRSMAKLSRLTNIPAKLINCLAKIYNWALRVSYYDVYMERCAYKRQQSKVQLMESDHFRMSNALVEKAYTYLSKNVNKLTPKDALNMLQLGIEYSRLSIGLNRDKPGSSVTAPTQPTLAIYNNTTNNNADQMVQVNQTSAFSSEVERQLHEDLKAEDNLLSILHVLQRSGAIDTALNEDLKDPTIVDVET